MHEEQSVRYIYVKAQLANPARMNRWAEIEVLAVCCGPDNPPRYPSVNSGEHYAERMRYMY